MAETRTNSELLVLLRHDERIPLHRQIETSIREAIRAGRLARGSSLPPTRMLAADLGVSRGARLPRGPPLPLPGWLAPALGVPRGVGVGAYQKLPAGGYRRSGAGDY